MLRSADYSTLKKSYIIFLCLDDPIGFGGYVYTKQSFFKEYPDKTYNDKTNVVFYNCKGYEQVDDSELRNVLEFIYTAKSNSPFTDSIEKSVDKVKSDETWRKEYMTINEVIRDEKKLAREEGVKEGKEEQALSSASQMLEDNMPIDKIATYTGLPVEKIEELAKKVTVPAQN